MIGPFHPISCNIWKDNPDLLNNVSCLSINLSLRDLCFDWEHIWFSVVGFEMFLEHRNNQNYFLAIENCKIIWVRSYGKKSYRIREIVINLKYLLYYITNACRQHLRMTKKSYILLLEGGSRVNTVVQMEVDKSNIEKKGIFLMKMVEGGIID